MSDPSNPDTPEPAPAEPATPGAETPVTPAAPDAPGYPVSEAAAAAADGAPVPQYTQPYPGAAPVPVTVPAAAQPAAAQPPTAQPPTATAPFPPNSAGYPGAPAGYPGAGNPQVAGQYPPATPPPGGAVPPGSIPPGGSVPPSGPGTTPTDTRPKTLAIVALGLAIVGALLAFIPFVNLISAPFLIAAIVIAIIALVSKMQGGTGFSIAALIVSVVAGMAAIIVTIVSVFLVSLGQSAPVDDGYSDDGNSEPYIENEDTDPVYGAEQELVLRETAFGDMGFGDGSWWYAVIIDNPNDDAVFDYEDLTVTALDADGAEIDSVDEYLTILPGTVAIVGSFEDLSDVQIAEIQVDLPGADRGLLVDPADLGALAVDDISATTEGTITTVTGTVTSTFAESADYVAVSVIARDASGAIVNAAGSYAENVPPGGGAPFDVLFFSPLADGMTLEAYAAF